MPQRGPYEASEGIYHGHGQSKLRVGKPLSTDFWAEGSGTGLEEIKEGWGDRMRQKMRIGR